MKIIYSFAILANTFCLYGQSELITQYTKTDSTNTPLPSKSIEINPNTNNEFVLYRETQSLTIYENCANRFKLLTPQNQKKHTLKSISTSSECSIEIEKDSSNKNVFIFIPQKSNAKTGRVGIFNNNTLVQEFTFTILTTPPFKIVESSTNQLLENLSRRGLNVNKSDSNLTLKAVSSDENFKFIYPKDFRFIIKNIDVNLVSGRRIIKTFRTQNNVIDLKNCFEIVKNDTTNAGYRLILEVTDVKRLNYKNQLINTPNSPLIFTFPLYKD